MTHQDVNTFAASLVEMALATKRVPELEAIQAELTRERDEALDRIARMEIRSVQRQIEIDNLHARIRDLEVARDDAELRFLEADDAKATILGTLHVIMGEAHSAIEAVDPTPVPPAAVVEEVPLVESPLLPSGSTSADHQSSADGPQGLAASSEAEAKADVEPSAAELGKAYPYSVYGEQGQSATDPTAPSPSGNSSPNTTSLDAEKSDDVALKTTAEEAPVPPVPFAASSSGDGSATVGEGASRNASSPGPNLLPSDPEPADQLSDQWWAWHRRNHLEAYQSHVA